MMNTKNSARVLILTLIAAMAAAFQPSPSRAAVSGGEVFLQGQYIEVGIHGVAGSFGTATNAPAGFHPRLGGALQLGFVVDPGKDGWTVGSPAQSGDYFLPGTPEEGWMIRWNGAGGVIRDFPNFGRMGSAGVVKSSLTETSSGDTRSAVFDGYATAGSEQIHVVQTVHFNRLDQFFVINTVLTNTGAVTLNGVKYLRNVDPDQEQPLTGSFTTSNYVVPPPASRPNQRLVIAKGLTYGLPLGLGAIDSRAVVSTEGFSNRNPDEILNTPVTPPPSSPIVADQAIALAFALGSLSPGQSVSFDHAYILNEADLVRALGNLAAVTILQPTGTVSGNNVLFQATTDDLAHTVQMDFYVNGLLVGSDNAPDAGGVFATSFSSLVYANGNISIEAVATFSDGHTVAKSSSVTVDNSGPPVSFTTPLPGATFAGSGIPIGVSSDDPAHPAVRVAFFRESASSGSLALGTDTAAPFESSFSVTGLPEGETVTIKAVAYDSAGRSTTIQVSGTTTLRTAPAITWPTPAAIVYGTPLSSTQLNATASVPGTFAYAPAAGAVLPAGQQTLNVTFTPSDLAHYTTATASVTLQVLKATPVITWAAPLPVTYGTALSATQLNATADVPGSLAYTPAAGSVLSAGSQTLSVSFAPSDAANYQSASATVTLQVLKATPLITWATPSPITYGTALSSAQLNASASVAGSFAYAPAAGSVLNAGTQTLSAEFTPSDTSNYDNATASVSLIVNKAGQTIHWSSPAGIVYGTPLSSAQLNATVSVVGPAAAGGLTYSPAAGSVLNAGDGQLLSVTAAETENYNAATASVTIDVAKATPVVTWATPAAIVYGTALSSAQLNAIANVPGSFAYTPAAGTLLGAGAQTLSVALTPADAANYNGASASVSLTVLKATPLLSWTAPAAINEGTVLNATQLSATASFNGAPVPGSFLYDPAAGTQLDGRSASYLLSVSFIPADGANFNPAAASVPLTVNNLPAAIGAITATPVPVQVAASVSLSASFTDAGIYDTHTAVWTWGDGETSPASIVESGGAGNATASHAYAGPGVYTVTLTVTDDDGGEAAAGYEYVVVYDPAGGFVTGGGTIDSPAGAYAADPALSGKATFGFNSKYQKGATVPTGQTQFQFHVAKFVFNSTSYDWLVVAGARAQYKGTGTVNGGGTYGFLLTAVDGQVAGGGGADRFRIKIWSKDTGGVVYDNGGGAADDAGSSSIQSITSGSIVIHN